jgi:hypothetical protein
LSAPVSELIAYMSQRLLKVAELNTVLDTFGESRPLPSAHKKQIHFVRHGEANPLYSGGTSKVSYNFAYRTVIANSDWLRVRRPDGRDHDLGFDFGGFDFGDEPQRLEIRELSAADREELERLGLF